MCEQCSPGEISSAGSSYCNICPQNSYEVENLRCNPCNKDLSTFVAGSSGEDTCITQEQIDDILKVESTKGTVQRCIASSMFH